MAGSVRIALAEVTPPRISYALGPRRVERGPGDPPLGSDRARPAGWGSPTTSSGLRGRASRGDPRRRRRRVRGWTGHRSRPAHGPQMMDLQTMTAVAAEPPAL